MTFAWIERVYQRTLDELTACHSRSYSALRSIVAERVSAARVPVYGTSVPSMSGRRWAFSSSPRRIDWR